MPARIDWEEACKINSARRSPQKEKDLNKSVHKSSNLDK